MGTVLMHSNGLVPWEQATSRAPPRLRPHLVQTRVPLHILCAITEMQMRHHMSSDVCQVKEVIDADLKVSFLQYAVSVSTRGAPCCASAVL